MSLLTQFLDFQLKLVEAHDGFSTMVAYYLKLYFGGGEVWEIGGLKNLTLAFISLRVIF